MKCQRCGENDANVSYTQIVNGDKTKLFLCDKCANDLNISMNFKFDFNDVFGAFFEEPNIVKTLEKPKSLACDACGTSYEDFMRTGMFGCENCYRVFSNRLDNVLKRLHGSNRHVGKKLILNPQKSVTTCKAKKKTKIEELRELLNECIKKEEYEKAAVIRDEIKKLETKKDIERGE